MFKYKKLWLAEIESSNNNKNLYLQELALNTEAKKYYLVEVKLSNEIIKIKKDIKNSYNKEDIETLLEKGLRLEYIKFLINKSGITEEEAIKVIDAEIEVK